MRVAIRCPLRWDALDGDDSVRHCHVCDRDVHNFSLLTRAEAEALVSARQGDKVCRVYAADASGEPLFADSPRMLRILASGVVVVAGLALTRAAAADASVPVATDVTVPDDATPADTLDPASIDLSDDEAAADPKPEADLDDLVEPEPVLILGIGG